MNVVAKAVFIVAVVFATVGHGASLNIIWQKKWLKQGMFWISQLIMNGLIAVVTDVNSAILL